MALDYVIKARARREIERLAQWWAIHRAAAPGHVRLDSLTEAEPGSTFTRQP